MGVLAGALFSFGTIAHANFTQRIVWLKNTPRDIPRAEGRFFAHRRGVQYAKQLMKDREAALEKEFPNKEIPKDQVDKYENERSYIQSFKKGIEDIETERK